jgi:GAF domain-containing protein
MRVQPGPFSEEQIALLKGFANQAVIAIENTRLFEAEQQRTRELTESLEQQTATSDVLQVISSSPGDLNPVFQTILANATRICEANFANIYRWDGNGLSLVATQNTPLAYVEARKRLPMRPDPKTPGGRMVATRNVVHVADLAADECYIERTRASVAAVELGGIRTVLVVPMMKENEFGRMRHRVPPGSSSLRRKADRAGNEFRSTSSYRHRECATAQRAAGVASAADRDRRCAQNH